MTSGAGLRRQIRDLTTRRMETQTRRTMSFSKRELALLTLILLVAAFLRLYRLDEVPPGLHGDTAYKGVAANRILRGEAYPIFFEESWGGVEPMYMYLLALVFRVAGVTPLAIKALSAVIGIITVPVFYLLVRELFGSVTIGLLASSWLAVSYWHISYSRLGWEIILAPLFTIVTLYFLWRGFQSGRWREFFWAGLAMGTSLYTYQAMRFLPILFISYAGYRIITENGFWRAYGPKLALSLCIAVMVFAPLGVYFATHSDAFFRRAREVSIFNPDKNPEGPLRSFVSSAVRILGTYNFRGDPLWRHNLPGRPAFGILTSVLFFIGLGVSVWRGKDPAYSLLLFWLAIMSLPPVLTPPRDVPHFSRMIGALPAACVLPAIGVQAAWHQVQSRWRSPRVYRALAAGVAMVLVVSLALAFRDYFVVWAGNENLRDHYFDGQFLDVGNAMNELDDAEAVWILPISALASPHDEAGHHTIEFTYRGQAPFQFLRLDEATAPEELSRLAQGRTKALLVDYKNYVVEEAYNYIDADPKQLAPFLLGKYGQRLEETKFDSFDVLTYELPVVPNFAIASSVNAASANFDGQLLVTGFDYGVYPQHVETYAEALNEKAVPSGGDAWVVLKWESLSDMPSGYKVALYLLDERERVVGQVDKMLLSNHMRLTSDWEPGQVEMDYYVLPSLPATPPGDYHVGLVVYDPATMQRLAVRDNEGNALGHTYRLAELRVVEAVSPPVVEPQTEVRDMALVPEMGLIGYDLPRTEVSPGEALEVALYWRAIRDVQDDYTVRVQLRDDTGHIWAEEESRPAYGDYPTTEWQSGEIIRDWHDLPVSVETPNGDYHLYVGLAKAGELTAEVELEATHVVGRGRSFEIPDMQHHSGWRLGEGIILLGYDLGQMARAGDVLKLTLYWQCRRQMDESYTVFTHLLDEDNTIWGQQDNIPASGQAPTSGWVDGEVITDHYGILVDAQAATGDYIVEVGMYDAETLQRLPVYGPQGKPQGDMVLLETVHVLR